MGGVVSNRVKGRLYLTVMVTSLVTWLLCVVGSIWPARSVGPDGTPNSPDVGLLYLGFVPVATLIVFYVLLRRLPEPDED